MQAGTESPSGFLLDWHSLRVGGLICAAVLCTFGFIVLMSKWRGLAGACAGQGCGFLPPTSPLPLDRWEMQMQVWPEAQVRQVPSMPVSC